jgi:hypothetical protein
MAAGPAGRPRREPSPARLGDPIERVPAGFAHAMTEVPHDAVLAAAGFSVLHRYEMTVVHDSSVDDVIGLVYSTSILPRPVLGDRAVESRPISAPACSRSCRPASSGTSRCSPTTSRSGRAVEAGPRGQPAAGTPPRSTASFRSSPGAGRRGAGRDGGRARARARGARGGRRGGGAHGDDIVLHNCPFHRLAEAHRALVCGMNRDFLGGVLDGFGEADELAARLDPQPGYCCVRISAA